MKKLIAVIMFTLLATTTTWAQADPAREVRQMERAWLDAYEKFDEKAMNTIVADDFMITFPDGSQQTKPQIISSLKMPRPPGSSMKFYTENVQARVYGDTVILSGRVVIERIRDGQSVSKAGQRYTDTYVKLNGRWQVVASHLSNEKAGQ